MMTAQRLDQYVGAEHLPGACVITAAARRFQSARKRVAKEVAVPEHIYKVIELVGSSETSIEDAINAALSRAGETLRHLRWFEVLQTRGQVEDGKVRWYQVAIKVGFTMEDGAAD
jgi:flavin-binding protein dodecin